MARVTTRACHLSMVMAGDGRSAALFRRGPSRHVLMIRWWLASDTFEIGQWFNGRVFPERCDLSYDGDLLVYFAGNWCGAFSTWTAVSRPPYFTALALWPKGDTWGGGGRFVTERLIALDHNENHMTMAEGFKLGKNFRVTLLDRVTHAAVVDGPKQGWRLHEPGSYDRTAQVFSPPRRFRQAHPRRQGIVLEHELRLYGRGVPGHEGSTFRVLDANQVLRTLPGPDIANWDSSGDLLASYDGKLFRISLKHACAPSRDPLGGARLLADFAPLTFSLVQAPASALKWP